MEQPLEEGDPRRVGRYAILRRIGIGGMSVVFRAFDPELDRHVALKLLDPAAIDGPQGKGAARLQREARAMAKVSHPNVVPVYDVGMFADVVYISMELIEGPTLGAWLEQTPRPWSEVVRMYLQAGRGLAAAHDAGMCHRDFKPDNVLVGADGRARVLDFGLARPSLAEDESDEILPADTATDMRSLDDYDMSENITATGIITGTPAYMSPEQHLGKASGPIGDQFSYCVALWEALYRQRPFAGRTAFAIADAIIDGRISAPPSRSRVPRWLNHLVLRGLNTEPEDRYESMRSLLAAIVFTGHVMHR